MNYSILKKRVGIAVAILILAAGVVAGRERPTVELVQERAPRAAAQAHDDGIDLERLRRGEASLPLKDPFSSKAVENKRSVQSKPAAPALPFQYFGRLTENGKTEVFVMRGEELLSIGVGEKVGDYRVEQIGATSIAFTYLPLKTRQTLEFQ